jgi:hypothetical protein
MDAGDDRPDWEDEAAYAPLLAADRSLHAWEWLRRDPAYRASARAGATDSIVGAGARQAAAPEAWGLHAFEPPERRVPEARPVWTAAVHPFVLVADVEPGAAVGDVFDRVRLAPLLSGIATGDREHLLLSDGLRTIRIDLHGAAGCDGPALRYRLFGIGSAEAPLLTLRRLLALHRHGRFARALHRPEARARRWLLLLRAADALAAGAGQREIAAVLLGRRAGEPLWRSRDPSLRSQAQRLVRGARLMAAGGWRALLR